MIGSLISVISSSKGAPTLVCGFWYSKKRTLTEFAIKQDITLSPKFTNVRPPRSITIDRAIAHPHITQRSRALTPRPHSCKC